MKSAFVKVCIVLVGLGNLGAMSYFLGTSYQAVQALPKPDRKVASEAEDSHPQEAGAHGEAKHDSTEAPGHGGGHGATAPSPALRNWVPFDEMYVNVRADNDEVYTLSFKLEVELFEDRHRHYIETHGPVVKDAVLEIARAQPYESLHTLGGKLFFKEALVAQMNQAVHFALVRDVHLSSFSLR